MISSIIPTSFRRVGGGGVVVILPSAPQNEPLKSPSRSGLTNNVTYIYSFGVEHIPNESKKFIERFQL